MEQYWPQNISRFITINFFVTFSMIYLNSYANDDIYIETGFDTYIVKENDNIKNIANKLKPANINLEYFINKILTINQLKLNSMLELHQRLKIPKIEKGELALQNNIKKSVNNKLCHTKLTKLMAKFEDLEQKYLKLVDKNHRLKKENAKSLFFQEKYNQLKKIWLLIEINLLLFSISVVSYFLYKIIKLKT